MTRDERLQAYKIATDPNFALSQTLAKVLASIQQIKGDDGYTPIKGKDYFTNDELSQIIAYIRSQLKDGIDGKDGIGIDGKDGRNGIDGETPIRGVDYYTSNDEDKLLKKVLSKIPKPKDGISVKPEEVTKIVMGNLEKLRKDDHTSIVNEILNNPVLRMLLHGGGSSAGTTSPLTTKGDIYGFSTANARVPVGADGLFLVADSTQALGVKWASSAGVVFVFNEDLTSQVPNTIFTLAFTPTAGTVRLYRGGSRQQVGVGKDYTILGLTITFATALQVGENLIADYQR